MILGCCAAETGIKKQKIRKRVSVYFIEGEKNTPDDYRFFPELFQGARSEKRGQRNDASSLFFHLLPNLSRFPLLLHPDFEYLLGAGDSASDSHVQFPDNPRDLY